LSEKTYQLNLTYSELELLQSATSAANVKKWNGTTAVDLAEYASSAACIHRLICARLNEADQSVSAFRTSNDAYFWGDEKRHLSGMSESEMREELENTDSNVAATLRKIMQV
jgi:hypothetical protein